MATFGFLVNLVLAGALFERAVHLSRPERWRFMRHDINRWDVQKSVRAFVGRYQRAVAARGSEQALTALFPDPGEGSADEAVRSLLDDARRAMSDHRHQEFRRSLDSIVELVKYAMDEIRNTEIQWKSPGFRPEWPPLRELSRNLYSFREDVIREGDRDYIFDLLNFDYRLSVAGIREHCGELFTVGLDGYRWNYQIANRIGGEFRELFRDRFSQVSDGLIFGSDPSDASKYIREMVRHQEQSLSDAMLANLPGDYRQLHSGFETFLRAVRLHWNVENWLPSQASKLYEHLRQEYRIALMGLGGRAVLLAESKRITDADPYLDLARGTYTQLGLMADDLASALTNDNYSNASVWQEWETEGAEPYQTFGVVIERYPLTFFTLRLMELSSDNMSAFDLHGKAERTLDWFSNNAQSVGSFVRAESEVTLEQRREFATKALRSAVRRDETAEDYEIIGRELSETRVSTFRTAVYTGAASNDTVERLFKQVGAFHHFAADSDNSPRERVFNELAPKAPFTDTPAGALQGYDRLDGIQYGRTFANYVLSHFCKSLESAPEIVRTFDTPSELLQAIDYALDVLNPSGLVAIVMAGDWTDLIVGLAIESPEGYQEKWQLPESEHVGEIARYLGHPIINSPFHENRSLYVVELAKWGSFAHAQVGGDQGLNLDIRAIPIERAREILAAEPELLADQPDEESRLRKLQTCVHIVGDTSIRFHLSDSTRARVIVAPKKELSTTGN